jgi:hypothetical protein
VAYTPADIRLKLFTFFAAQLALYVPSTGGCVFACPLCRKVFNPDALEGSDPPLTLAHVVPEALGGSDCVLTCKSCNSTLGSKVDAHMVKEQRVHEFYRGERAARITMTTPDGLRIATEGTFRNNKWELRHLPKQTNPTMADELIARMKSDWSKFEFSLSVEHFNLDLSLRAAYHAAFLAAFREFGYEFAFSPGGKIAARIVTHGEGPFRLSRLVIPAKDHNPETLPSLTVGILRHPAKYKCIMVRLPAIGPDETSRAVFLPGPKRSDILAYKELSALDQPFGDYDAVSLSPVWRKRLDRAETKWMLHTVVESAHLF